MKKLTRLSVFAVMLCGFSFMHAQVPPTAPPDPEYPADQVLSFFSEKYGEAFPDMATVWNPPTSWDYTATGDEEAGIIVIRNLDWLPIALGGNAQLKNYEYVHIDVFCNEETQFRVGFHRHEPGNEEKYFPMIEKEDMVPGKWYSIDYSLDDFFINEWGGGFDAHYLRFGGEVDGPHDFSDEIYITNFILFNGTPTCLGGVVREPTGINGAKEATAFNEYAVNGTLHVSSGEIISKLDIYNVAGQLVKTIAMENTTGAFNVAGLNTGIYMVAAQYADGKNANQRIVIK